MELIEKYVLPDQYDVAWLGKILASIMIPFLVILFRPLGLAENQAVVVAAVILAVTWWSTGWVKKIPTSFMLLAVFSLFGKVSYEVIFSFPLSETFLMIAITYLFSQAITNVKIVDILLLPVLSKAANTAVKCLLMVIGMFAITMYVIPQPLARLIVVASVFEVYLKNTDVDEKTYSVLMYAVFVFYAIVNMATRNADIIMNNVAVGFAGTSITDGQWASYMLVPTIGYCALVLALFVAIFRKELLGVHLQVCAEGQSSKKTQLDKKQKQALAVILVTVILWMTNSIHGINNTLITFISTGVLFGIKALHKEDFKAIDVTTLIFLTAAFSIGGVMKACGAADIVFGLLKGIFPENFSVGYMFVMVFVSMLLHMILGSNTTTLSVVVPGLVVLCGNMVSPEVIALTAVIGVAFHAILPFHSVALMIGYSKGYFPAKYVSKLGIPVTVLVYVAAICIYLPWWKLMGYL